MNDTMEMRGRNGVRLRRSSLAPLPHFIGEVLRVGR